MLAIPAWGAGNRRLWFNDSFKVGAYWIARAWVSAGCGVEFGVEVRSSWL